jgi:hypothetical protein
MNEDTKIVEKIRLTRYRDGWSADHFGAMAYFYTIKHEDVKGVVTERWVWSYNEADSRSFERLEDCVENWKDTAGIYY